MSLSPEELERYARHIVLRDIGGPGQQKLKAARVLVIGAGGLGSPLVAYLAAAGIGTIGVADDDRVSLSNLQRQIIHTTGDVGRLKTDSARDAVSLINPHVQFVPHQLRVSDNNVRDLVRGYDLVSDGTDNFDTRYLLSDACFHEKKPLVTATLGQFDGTLTTLRPFEAGPDGLPNPTWRCLFPEKPAAGTIPTCAEAGILGAVAGMLGTMMALEVIRQILGGFGEADRGLVGKLLMVDARAMRFETLEYSWDPDNPLNGSLQA